MSVELPAIETAPEPIGSTVLQAELKRREFAARYLALAMGVLGVPATLAAMRGMSSVWELTLIFTVIMFVVYGMSYVGRAKAYVGGLLMGSMLVEHILVVARTPGEVYSPTPFFSCIVIFIAIATSSYKGVIAATVATFSALGGMTYLRAGHIASRQAEIELPVPFVLALTFAVVAIVQARAAHRALKTQMARERDLQLAREEIKLSYEEKLRLSQELENSKRLESLGKLAGTVAHDFNNLLTVVAGSAEIAQRAKKPEVVQQELDVILQLVDKSTALNKQLLTFGKRMAQRLEPVELGKAVEAICPLLHRAAGEHVRVRCEHAPQPIFVTADRSQLEQVLMNLTVNARDALRDVDMEKRRATSPPAEERSLRSEPPPLEPTIRLVLSESVETTSGGVRRIAVLKVRDNGTGMPEEVREHIFEPYFTTKADERGTGLGLSTVYGIVDRWGGSIEVESTLGKGTTFTIRIPMLEQPPASTAPPAEQLGAYLGELNGELGPVSEAAIGDARKSWPKRGS